MLSDEIVGYFDSFFGTAEDLRRNRQGAAEAGSQQSIGEILTQEPVSPSSYESMREILLSDPSLFDAEGRHLAPNGQPSNLTLEQWIIVRTPEFKAWFGDWELDPENASKVVDGNGEPLVVYHGTGARFSEFSYDELGSREGSFFFAQNLEDAQGYASGIVMPVFLNLRNPISFNDIPAEVFDSTEDKAGMVEWSKQNGYDGWMTDMDTGWGELSAFYPSQVKSAISNSGAFSPETGNIYFQNGNGNTTEIKPNLMVTHTLSESNLSGAIEIGGLVMPSLGITRPDLIANLTQYGRITLVGDTDMGRSLVREGAVYDRDMWSPIFPRPEYTVDKRKLDSIISRLNKYAISDRRLLSSVDAYSEYQYADPDDFAARLDGDNAHMAYAAEKGIPYETVYTHMPTDSYTSDFIVKAKAWLDKNRTRLSATGFDSDFENDMWNALRPYMKESFRERYGERFTQREIAKTNGIKLSLFSELNPADAAAMETEETWDKILLNTQLGYRKRDMYSLMRLAESYDPEAMIVDETTTIQNLNEALKGHDVRAWVREQISDAYSEPFLRIGRTKAPVTAENILRYMMRQNIKGNSGFIGTLSSAASRGSRRLASMRSLHDAESLLGPKGEGLDNEYTALVREHLDTDNAFEAFDGMTDIIGEYLSGTTRLDKPLMRRLIMNEQGLVTRDEATADAFAEFAEKLRNETRPYFEAKPRRILQISDFTAAFVDPAVSAESRQMLADAGLDVIEAVDRSAAAEAYAAANGEQILFQESTDAETQARSKRLAFERAFNALIDATSEHTIIGEHFRHEKPTSSKASKILFRSIAPRGIFTNNETQLRADFGRSYIDEISGHDWSNEAHLASIMSAPQIFENALYVGKFRDTEGRLFDYFLSVFDYDGDSYLVRSVAREGRGNEFYYDHKLTRLEKIKDWASSGFRLSTPGLDSANPSIIEDTRLQRFLQEDLSERTALISSPFVTQERKQSPILFQGEIETPEQKYSEGNLLYRIGNKDNKLPIWHMTQAVSELRRRHIDSIADKSRWDNAQMADFYHAYKDGEIVSLIRDFPKVIMDGIQMFEGMIPSDMPFQKELI